MATTVNVSLPEPLKDFVDEQVKRGGYSSTSDYVRQLIREHRARVDAVLMALYLLDTDISSYLIRKRPVAVLARMDAVPLSQQVISVVT